MKKIKKQGLHAAPAVPDKIIENTIEDIYNTSYGDYPPEEYYNDAPQYQQGGYYDEAPQYQNDAYYSQAPQYEPGQYDDGYYSAPQYEEYYEEQEPPKKSKKSKKSKVKKEKQPKPPKPPKAPSKFWKKLKITFFVLCILFILFFAGALYAGYSVTSSSTNLPKVYIGEVKVGGLTREETIEELNKYGWDEKAGESFKLYLPANVSADIVLSDAGVMMLSENAADLAYAYGHNGNWISWFDNLKKYANGLLKRVDVMQNDETINSEYVYSKIDAAIKSVEAKLETKEEYTVDEKKGELTLIKGANQIKLEREELYNAVVAGMRGGEESYEYTVDTSELKKPDFNKIYDALAIEPVDAYFDYDSKTIVDSVDGFSFDTEKAAELWERAKIGEKVIIPVEVIEPEVTSDSLNEILFADILGQMTTSFAGSNSNRINNIELAASKVHELILNPGEIFSYNETVGKRTEEAGFLPAGAYADGEVVEEVGGGICQVSSTIFAATLYARLHTVFRQNHYFAVNYMDKGMDATVSWGNPDFKFQNNTDYPIKIMIWVDRYDTQTMTVAIMGTDVDHYSCKIWSETFTHSEDYTYNGNVYPSVPTAIVTCTYRDVYDADGNLLFTEATNRNNGGDVYYDYYYLHKEDIIARLPALPAASEGDGSVEIG